MPQCQFLFSAVFVFQDDTKAKPPIFPDMKMKSKAEVEEGQGPTTS
jgi:hypothetical protein